MTNHAASLVSWAMEDAQQTVDRTQLCLLALEDMLTRYPDGYLRVVHEAEMAVLSDEEGHYAIDMDDMQDAIWATANAITLNPGTYWDSEDEAPCRNMIAETLWDHVVARWSSNGYCGDETAGELLAAVQEKHGPSAAWDLASAMNVDLDDELRAHSVRQADAREADD